MPFDALAFERGRGPLRLRYLPGGSCAEVAPAGPFDLAVSGGAFRDRTVASNWDGGEVFSGIIETVYAPRALEAHAQGSTARRWTLWNWNRVLAPGGTLWLSLPREGTDVRRLLMDLADVGLIDVAVTHANGASCHGEDEVRIVARKGTESLALTAQRLLAEAGVVHAGR